MQKNAIFLIIIYFFILEKEIGKNRSCASGKSVRLNNQLCTEMAKIKKRVDPSRPPPPFSHVMDAC